MSEPYPADLVCPITQDLMNEPVTVTHLGKDYTFDRVGFEIWKTTDGGDQNPLTMLEGFRDAPFKESDEIKRRVHDYREMHGMTTDVKTEKTELQPFSDYQQIQDDEQEARRLHRELNGSPPIEWRVNFRWNTPDGMVERSIDIPPIYRILLEGLSESSNIRARVLDQMCADIALIYPSLVPAYDDPGPPVYGPEIPEGGLPVPEDTSNNFAGMRTGFLN